MLGESICDLRRTTSYFHVSLGPMRCTSSPFDLPRVNAGNFQCRAHLTNIWLLRVNLRTVIPIDALTYLGADPRMNVLAIEIRLTKLYIDTIAKVAFCIQCQHRQHDRPDMLLSDARKRTRSFGQPM